MNCCYLTLLVSTTQVVKWQWDSDSATNCLLWPYQYYNSVSSQFANITLWAIPDASRCFLQDALTAVYQYPLCMWSVWQQPRRESTDVSWLKHILTKRQTRHPVSYTCCTKLCALFESQPETFTSGIWASTPWRHFHLTYSGRTHNSSHCE